VAEQAAIQQALAVLGIEMAHREALRQTQRRFAVELFDLARAAEAQAPAIRRRLVALGLDPDGALVAIVCELAGAEERMADFEHALGAAGLRAVAAARGGSLVAVAQWEPRGRDAAPVAAQLAAAMGAQAAVGIGAAITRPALLEASVAEARRACRLARLRRDGRGGASAGELATHTGLLAQQDPDLLEGFWRALLDPLIEHDAARASELLSTLETFLRSGGRWAQTAELLHVHVNTLRHRLSRVEELTGRRIDDPDDRVDLHLALRARQRVPGRP
jgi:sugar diacid utilization regulator